MKARIKRWGINGEGIAYVDRKPVFIDDAIPTELVEIKLTEENDRYGKGEVIRRLEESPRRRKPLCPKWKSCGGCGLMHVDYKGQIRMKENALKEALRKYAHYTGPIEPMIKNPKPLAYRNACKLPIGIDEGKTVTGMYKKGSNIFVPLERCMIHDGKLEAVRIPIGEILTRAKLPVCFKQQKNGLKNLVIKQYDGKLHVILVSTPMEIPQEVVDEILALPDVASVWQNIKTSSDPDHELFGARMKHLGGQEKMSLHLNDIELDLLPKSFFQLNTPQAITLYEAIAQMIPAHSGLLVEAYCGVGAISLFVADKASKVIGIETIPDAVTNARSNALLNHKENVEFICGDAGKEMKKIVVDEHVDTLIVDPPRTGLGPDMINAVLRDKPQTMIYVSCNPSTLAKDLDQLQKVYSIEKVQPIDFFSQTPHVETLVKLTLKSNKA